MLTHSSDSRATTQILACRARPECLPDGNRGRTQGSPLRGRSNHQLPGVRRQIVRGAGLSIGEVSPGAQCGRAFPVWESLSRLDGTPETDIKSGKAFPTASDSRATTQMLACSNRPMCLPDGDRGRTQGSPLQGQSNHKSRREGLPRLTQLPQYDDVLRQRANTSGRRALDERLHSELPLYEAVQRGRVHGYA